MTGLVVQAKMTFHAELLFGSWFSNLNVENLHICKLVKAKRTWGQWINSQNKSVLYNHCDFLQLRRTKITLNKMHFNKRLNHSHFWCCYPSKGTHCLPFKNFKFISLSFVNFVKFIRNYIFKNDATNSMISQRTKQTCGFTLNHDKNNQTLMASSTSQTGETWDPNIFFLKKDLNLLRGSSTGSFTYNFWAFTGKRILMLENSKLRY